LIHPLQQLNEHHGYCIPRRAITEFSTVERKFPHAITDFSTLQSSPLNLRNRYALLDRIFGMNERGGGEVA
jgi:hypothetical protein